MNAVQTAVAAVVNLLVERAYDEVEAMTRSRWVTADDLRRVIGEYGRTLVSLPPAALESLDIVAVVDADPPAYSVVVDLWTSEEGKSDLSLELKLVDRYGGAYEVEITDLHVL